MTEKAATFRNHSVCFFYLIVYFCLYSVLQSFVFLRTLFIRLNRLQFYLFLYLIFLNMEEILVPFKISMPLFIFVYIFYFELYFLLLLPHSL